MTHLTQIGSQTVQRLVQFRARPDAPLLAAIEEAVRSEASGRARNWTRRWTVWLPIWVNRVMSVFSGPYTRGGGFKLKIGASDGNSTASRSQESIRPFPYTYSFRIRFRIYLIATGATRLRNVMAHNPMVMGDP